MRKKLERRLDLQLFAEEASNENTNKETSNENEYVKINEIDYDRIINGVFEKMNSVESKKDNSVITTPDDNKHSEYVEKSVEFEMKYNNLNKDYDELNNKYKELNSKYEEANNKLKEYETFGKTSEEIKENSRILNDTKKSLGGLIKL